MAKFDNQKYTHPDHKKLHLFRRPNSPYWWCGFHNKGIYHRSSTKCKNKPDANDFADEWYFNKQVEIRTGKIPQKIKAKNSHTVKEASIDALQEYRILVKRGDRSNQYLISVIKYLNKHVLPYFGNMAVDEINPAHWYKFIKSVRDNNPRVANGTLKQIRNSLQICMNSAVNLGWIQSVPTFKITNQSTKNIKGRVWFKPNEVEILLKALDENVELHRHTPHRIGAQELRDYVKFILFTGLRVSEINNITFKDMDVIKSDHSGYPHIIIRNINGKRGVGDCNADRKLNGVYSSIFERVQPDNKNEKLFKVHHRDMFNVVLKNCNLKHDAVGRKRDFISLRHTYICNKIIDGISLGEIAVNCRTSTDMIDKHYARYLQAELLQTLHVKEDKEIAENFAKVAHLREEIKAKDERFVSLGDAMIHKISGISNSEMEKIMNDLKKLQEKGSNDPIQKLAELSEIMRLSPKDIRQIFTND